MTHHPRKRFGQNFLHDSHVIAEIIALINPRPNQHIVEIGPGQGALTRHLIATGAKISAVEIDRDLAEYLQKNFSAHKNFDLHCADILKFSLAQLGKPLQHLGKQSHKLRIVGNLPYNISTPLLFKLFSELALIEDMYFMLQKEVAQRLIAHPSTKDYGRLSIMAQYYCDMYILLHVPPTAFAPQPKVDSCIVQFIPHPSQIHVDDHALLYNLVTTAFSQRRKTIANALKDFLSQEELQILKIDPMLRAENLRLLDYTNIANHLTKG